MIPWSACEFNVTKFKTLAQLFKNFPFYLRQLGNEILKNALVHIFDNGGGMGLTKEQRWQQSIKWTRRATFQDGKMSCVFMDDKSNIIEMGRSVVEDLVGTSLSLGVISVVCPVPAEAVGFHLMRLERTVDDKELQTPLFPVCRIHLPKKATPEFNLTMCTATDRSNRMYVVEWMEYYKLQGDQQFVVYNLVAMEYDRQAIHGLY